MEDTMAPAGDNQVKEVSPDTGSGQGESGASWRDRLPEPLKQSKTLAKFSKEEDLAKSYVELEGKLGKSLSMPDKDAAPDEWHKFYDKIGRPKQSEDYVLDPVEGFGADGANTKQLKKAFHEIGLTQAQANKVFSHIATQSVKQVQSMREAVAKSQEQHQAALKQEWGPRYEERMELTKRYIAKVGGEGALKHLDQLGVSGDAVVLKLIGEVAKTMEAHQFVDGTPSGKKPSPYPYMDKT